MAAGEVVWVGVDALGEHDGRIALYLADHLPRLMPPAFAKASAGRPAEGTLREMSDRESAIVEHLRTHGASFFAPLHEAAGGGYPAETVDALWALAWRGLVTNDTFHSLRAFMRARASSRRKPGRTPAPTFRSRRMAPPSAEGRWTLVSRRSAEGAKTDVKAEATKWAAAFTGQLLARHGVVTREAASVENIPGGFSTVYPVLKELEERGRVRRGYFVAGLGATQFAAPGAVELLRSLRDMPDEPEVVALAATDPANPYGATLPWTSVGEARAAGARPMRAVGTTVILVDGALVAYVGRGDRQVTTFLPESEPMRSRAAHAIARTLCERASASIDDQPRGILVEDIDGVPAATHPLAPYLADAGFVSGALGMTLRPQTPIAGRASLLPRRPSRRLLSSPFSPRNFVDSESEPEQ